MTELSTTHFQSHYSGFPTPMRVARRFWYAARRVWWSQYFRLNSINTAAVPKGGAALFCSNHTSHLDAIAILAALPRDVALRTFTAAARDVFGDFRLRRLISRLTTNALPIQRSAEFSCGLRQLESVLRNQQPLILFPEGKRSSDGRMSPFKNGAAMLSVRTGSPIVPIYIAGADKALPRGSAIPKAARVRVEFGQPIDPARYIKAIDSREKSRHEAYESLSAELRGAISAMNARHKAAGHARTSHAIAPQREVAANLSPAL